MSCKSLVVGGSGFVGQELCRQLKARGDDVATLDRIPGPPDLAAGWIKADFTNLPELEQALKDRQFDVIFHVASLPGDTGNPPQMVQVNVLGLTQMLDCARRNGVRRFVVTSSISAYEWYPATPFHPPDYQPVDEEHPCRPRDMYASSKRIQEILAMTFYHQYGLPTVALRLTAVVGPEGRGGGRGWGEFAAQLHGGKSVQIPHLSLDEVCHYVDLRDVARMHIAAAEHPGAVGEIFNCCGPAPVSGHELAAIIRKYYPGIEVQTGFPWSMAQGGKIQFDMAKARKLMDYQPLYSMEDSIVAIKQWIDGGGLRQARATGDATYGAGVQA